MSSESARHPPATTVSEALASRRSIRAFLDWPVDLSLVRRIIAQATRAPSGGNLQPWHLYALTGDPLAELKRIMRARMLEAPAGEGADGEGVEYRIYPKTFESPYRDRRVAFGDAMYTVGLGIAREDAAERQRWMQRNYQFFDAPVALFAYVDRHHGPPQWADVGMYLQSVMLLLREAGLDSCPQMCWARYALTVSNFLKAPPGLMLYTGMAIGHADMDHPVNRFQIDRAPVDDVASFLGF